MLFCSGCCNQGKATSKLPIVLTHCMYHGQDSYLLASGKRKWKSRLLLAACAIFVNQPTSKTMGGEIVLVKVNVGPAL
jgi:hypothetical protein